jgi:diguanylate cyclase (GGDEF)-like protein
MAKVEGADDVQKAKLREELLYRFNDFFLNEQLSNMQVFHIFDREGKSFLRFHQESKFGDPIYLSRFSLRNLKEKVIAQHGLEVGRYQESFRFQFPLFYNGEFVGMYEYGMGFEALAYEMKDAFGGDYCFLLKKGLIDKEVVQSAHQKRYMTTALSDGFYALKTLHRSKEIQQFLAALAQRPAIAQQLETSTQSFSVILNANNTPYMAVFLQIKDIEDHHVGYYVLYEEGNYLNILLLQLAIFYLLISAIMGGIMVYIYNINKNRDFVDAILNSQRDMIFLTDGYKLRSVNAEVLSFFNYESLGAFLREHDCICDFFIEEKGYVGKMTEGLIWLDYLIKYPEALHKVKMYSVQEKHNKIFEISFKAFKETQSYIITMHDITRSENLKNELEHSANFDALTQIFNRNRFNYYLEKELSRASRYDVDFSLIMFDIDHFKEVNDTYGHDVGDSVLEELASLIQKEIRDNDIFARWGGEEFMIIASTDVSQSEKFAEKLRKSVESYRFRVVEKITCSFGVVGYRKEDDFKTLTKRCDTMLYSAKSAGRNCVVSMY